VPEQKAPIFNDKLALKITFSMKVKKLSVISYQPSVKTNIFSVT